MGLQKVILVMVLGLLLTGRAEEQVDSNIQEVSQFLIQLISKYDTSGKGAIPVTNYPAFLVEVFVNGYKVNYPQAVISHQILELLSTATTNFTTKYKEVEQVGLQQFYMDLIKDFTIFVTENSKEYGELVDTFYADTQMNKAEIKGESEVEKIDL